MRLFTLLVIGLVLILQYRIWFGDDGLREYRQLQQQIDRQMETNDALVQRNQLMFADIEDLRGAKEAVEERARNELGMVLPEETFFRMITIDEQVPQE